MNRPPADLSPRMISLARAIERACRRPGRYTIILVIPDRPRAPWTVEIARLEALRKLEVNRPLEGG